MRRSSVLVVCSWLVLLVRGIEGFNGYLYVFSGNTNGSDFVATVDLVNASSTYGCIVNRTPIPGASVEAHHVGLVNGGSVLAGGSYLDFALNVPSVHFFNVTDPASPSYISSVNASYGSVPDSFASVPGGFVATFMGNKMGGSPGRVVRFDNSLQVTGEFVSTTSESSFNPHGIAVHPNMSWMLTADFYEPASAIRDQSRRVQTPVSFRWTVRLWNLSTFSTTHVFDAGQNNADGFMDVKFLGNTQFAVAGNGKGQLYLIDILPQANGEYNPRNFRPIWRAPTRFSPSGTCVSAVFRGGTRVLVSSFLARALFLLDFATPQSPRLLHTLRLPEGAHPHAIVTTPDGSLVAVTCYFLDRPTLSKFDDLADTDKTLRFFQVVNDTIQQHPAGSPLRPARCINSHQPLPACLSAQQLAADVMAASAQVTADATTLRAPQQCPGGAANPHGMALKAVPIVATGR